MDKKLWRIGMAPLVQALSLQKIIMLELLVSPHKRTCFLLKQEIVTIFLIIIFVQHSNT